MQFKCDMLIFVDIISCKKVVNRVVASGGTDPAQKKKKPPTSSSSPTLMARYVAAHSG